VIKTKGFDICIVVALFLLLHGVFQKRKKNKSISYLEFILGYFHSGAVMVMIVW